MENSGQFKNKTNKYEHRGDYVIGYDCNDKSFKISVCDYEKIKKYCWYVNDRNYVKTTIGGSKSKKVPMHRFLLKLTDPKILVDHINHDETDNRRENLRECNNSQNAMNAKKAVRGIYYTERLKKWRVFISINNKRTHLGYFSDYKNALNARKSAESKYFKEFANINGMNYG